MSTTVYAGTTELNAMTRAYFEADGGKAWDAVNQDSYAVNYFDKQKKGLFKVVKGGNAFDFPIVVDEVSSMPYNRASSTVSRTGTAGNSGSWENQVTSKATFAVRNIISSVKMLRLDVIQNAGAQALASVLKTRLEACLRAHSKVMAQGLYYNYTQAADPLPWTGIRMCCYEDDPTNGFFGGIEHDALGDDQWEGRRTDMASAPISLAGLRTLRKTAKIRDGKNGRPDLCTIPEDLFSSIQDIAGTLIRLEPSTEAAKFGFTAVVHEGMTIAADDYCPSGVACLFNTAYWGCRFLEGGHHDKSDFKELVTSAGDYFMDIFANGNWVTPARRAHIIGYDFVA